MAEIHKLEERLTYKYVDQHSDLDHWEETDVKVKLLAVAFTTDPGNGYDEGPTTVRKLVLMTPRKMDINRLERLVHHNFAYSGCSHEHDCCGCGSARVELKRIKGREFKLTTIYRYNY